MTLVLHKQVILESNEDKDVTGHPLPNLIYVSREKNKSVHHNFKGGALNSMVCFTDRRLFKCVWQHIFGSFYKILNESLELNKKTPIKTSSIKLLQKKSNSKVISNI